MDELLGFDMQNVLARVRVLEKQAQKQSLDNWKIGRWGLSMWRAVV